MCVWGGSHNEFPDGIFVLIFCKFVISLPLKTVFSSFLLFFKGKAYQQAEMFDKLVSNL